MSTPGTRLVVEAARRVFAKNFDVVADPDHPFLVRGPNVLVGGAERLYALFMPNKSERDRPHELLARLAMSRLALPPHAVCALASDGSGSPDHDAGVRIHFDALVPLHAPKKWDLPKERLVEQTELPTRRLVLRRMAFILGRLPRLFGPPRTVGTLSPAIRAVAESQRALLPSWLAGSPKTFASLRMTSDYNLLALMPTLGTGASRFAHLIEASMRLDFNLDRGRPFARHANVRLPVHALIVRRLPTARWDPLRAVRAGAMAGWLPIPALPAVVEHEIMSIRRRSSPEQ